MAKEHELLFRINAQMGSSYQATFREATAAMGSLRDEYNALANTAKDIAAYQRQAQAVENTKAKLELLQQQYANIQREISETGGFSSDLENKLASKQHQIDKTTEALQNQTDKLGQYETALQQAGVDTNNLEGESKRLEGEMDDLRKEFDETGDGAEEFGEKTTTALSDVEAVLVSLGLAKLVQELSDQIKACAEASMEFEVGMASVRRTVGGSEEEIAALGEEFQEMAATMPITTSELAQIATTAGQLGIAQDYVEDFTRVMAELATTTDLSADRAATLLAQFSNITGTTDYDRLGSTVAALGDSTATTASRIVEMSQGMASAATIAGMSAQDVLGIAAAVGALGGRTQTGATAMSQLITKIQLAVETGEGLEGYAQTAGLTALEFKHAWGEDAAGALNTFIQGLNDTERNGKSALAVLNDIGISNARQLRVFTGLATSGDLLSRSLNLANQSWSENSALAEKAGIMYDTTRAKMTTMQNQVNNLKIAFGDQLNPALGRVYEVIGRVAGSLADFVKANPGVVRAITAVAVALGVLAAALATTTVAIKAFDIITKTSFGPAGWIMLGVEAVIALAAGIGALALTADHTSDSIYQMDEAIRGMDDAMKASSDQMETAESDTEAAAFAVEHYIARLEELEAAGLNSTSAQKEYSAIINEINRLMPGINAQIDEQTGLVEGGASSLHKLADGWKEAAMAQVYYETASAKMEAWSKLNAQVLEDEERLNVLRANTPAILTEIEDKENALAALQEKRNQLTPESFGSAEEFFAKQAEYDSQIMGMQEDIASLYGSMTGEEQDAMVEMGNLTNAIAAGKAKMAEYESEIEGARGKMDSYTDATGEATDATEAESGPMEAVTEQLDLLAAAYDEAYEAALKSIEKQFDLWDEAPEIVATGAEAINTNLDSQIGYWEDYSTNLDNLMGRNIEGLDTMLASFADGSKESAEMIAGLASMGDEELQGVVEKYNDLKGAQKEVADELATANIDIDNAMRAVVSTIEKGVKDMDQSTEARISAMATLDAYISAAEGQKGRVAAAYAAIAHAAQDALIYGGMTVITRTEDIGRVGYGGAAGGIDNAPEGWRWVGELGPELMYFQGGETVIPHTKSVEMLQGGDRTQVINVTLAPSYQISGGGSTENIREILEEHDRQLPGKVTAILREAERDAVRRSYS